MGDSDGLWALLVVLLRCLPFIVLIGLGWFVGGYQERRHLKELACREAGFSGMLVTQLKTCPGAVSGPVAPSLVIGEVVIATDYLKSIFATVRKLVGGEVRSYQSLLDRARREALLRMMQEARGLGFNAVCNVRFEMADVGGNTTQKKIATVAMLASGTAYQVGTATLPDR